MKPNTRIFLKSFCISLIFSGILAFFIILTQIPSYEKQNNSSFSAVRGFEAGENDKFNLLITISGQENSPHTYLLLGFNGQQEQISVCRLFPQTLLSQEGEKKVILKECFDAAGAGGAAKAISSFFSIDVSKYISFTNSQLLSFFELFDPISISVSENLSQVDRKNDIYIKIDKGRQIMGGILILDYLAYTKWECGESGALYEGARIVSEFMRQNAQALSLSSGSAAENFLLGNTRTNISITDIEKRRELISFLFKENSDSIYPIGINGNFAAQNTEYIPSISSTVKISALFS